MRESEFIERNGKDWEEVERALSTKARDREKLKLGDRFIQISDDLSYAQSYYKRRSVKVYLNDLTLKVFRVLFKYHHKEKGGFARFWTRDIPEIMWSNRKSFRVSLAIFAVCMVIGAFSLEINSAFAHEILGSGYMSMTEENIKSGDPMAVYKSSNSYDMFISIALNNLKVMIIAFILGLFAGIGTIGILVSNGVMLGVFQYYFYKQGLLWTSFLTIWQHGTIEISCIVLSGGAGLMLGHGYFYPGTYSRLTSLRIQFFRGVKVILALMPFIVLAAWIESYITRHDTLPDWIRFLFILVNAALIVYFFIGLPMRFGRRRHLANSRPDEYAPPQQKTIDPTGILTSGEIVQLALESLWTKRKKWLPVMFSAMALIAAFFFFDENHNFPYPTFQPGFSGIAIYDALISFYTTTFSAVEGFNMFDWKQNPASTLIFILSIGVLSGILFYRKTKNSKSKVIASGFLFTLLLSILIYWVAENEYSSLIFIVVGFPILLIALQMSMNSGGYFIINLYKGSVRFLSFLMRLIVWQAVVFIILLLLIGITQSALHYFLIDLFNTIVDLDNFGGLLLIDLFTSTVQIMCWIFAIALYIQGLYLHCTSIEEIQSARNLRREISQIQLRKNRYGIEERV